MGIEKIYMKNYIFLKKEGYELHTFNLCGTRKNERKGKIKTHTSWIQLT